MTRVPWVFVHFLTGATYEGLLGPGRGILFSRQVTFLPQKTSGPFPSEPLIEHAKFIIDWCERTALSAQTERPPRRGSPRAGPGYQSFLLSRYRASLPPRHDLAVLVCKDILPFQLLTPYGRRNGYPLSPSVWLTRADRSLSYIKGLFAASGLNVTSRQRVAFFHVFPTPPSSARARRHVVRAPSTPPRKAPWPAPELHPPASSRASFSKSPAAALTFLCAQIWAEFPSRTFFFFRPPFFSFSGNRAEGRVSLEPVGACRMKGTRSFPRVSSFDKIDSRWSRPCSSPTGVAATFLSFFV